MNIYLFGKSSLSGESFFEYFKSKNKKDKIYPFSRDSKSIYKLDLKKPSSFNLINNNKFLIISFAPIWDLSYFLNYLFYNEKYKLKNLNGILACSSTSSLTKRFESNQFDKNLTIKLLNSEKNIMKIAKKLKISCQIIRPTMIYGEVKGVEDKNISKILLIMRSLKFIALPSNSGNRQPIHAIQLAKVFFSLMRKSLYDLNKSRREFINVGGDEIFNYEIMVQRLKDSLSKKDKGKKCLVIKIPNRLFFISIMPVMFFSPKTFAALSRVCSDLSGFKKACEITNTDPKKFPYY